MDTRADLIGMGRVLPHHHPVLESGWCGNLEEGLLLTAKTAIPNQHGGVLLNTKGVVMSGNRGHNLIRPLVIEDARRPFTTDRVEVV